MRHKRGKEELPYVTVHLSPEEQQALNNEPPELWVIYIIISRLRDFDTNIAGEKTRICDRTFKEQLEVSKRSGRQGGRPPTSSIQSWLKQLENLGLIENRGNYVFYLPKAHKKESDQMRFYQFVDKGFTNSFTNMNTSESTESITNNQLIHNQVLPEVLPEVLPVSYIPHKIQKNTTTTMSDDAFLSTMPVDSLLSPFINLLGRNFGPRHLHLNTTLAMIRLWIKAGITIENAKKAIDDQNLIFVPDTPAYYKNAVLKANATYAEKPQLEINNATTTNAKKPYVNHYEDAKRAIEKLAADAKSESNGQQHESENSETL